MPGSRFFRGAKGASTEEDASIRQQVDRELETHLELRTEELVGRGLAPSEARAEALRRLGRRRELYLSARRRDRRLRRAALVDSLARDLHYALRRALGQPLVSVLSIATFALGIGLALAGFTVVDRVLIRSLPFPESERVVVLESVTEEGVSFPRAAAASWLQWQSDNQTLEATALLRNEEWSVAGSEEAIRVAGQLVTADFFEVLGAPMRIGRALGAEDAASGSQRAVISERFWLTRLGAPSELPIELMIDGRPASVVGVLPDRYRYPAESDLWVAHQPRASAHPEAHTWINFQAIARLEPGVSHEQAAADLSRIAHGLREESPRAIYSYGVAVMPLRELLVGNARLYLLLLLASVSFVLLIACANLSGLGLARATARAREMGVRVAVGAGRLRLISQLLVEQLALALAGGVLGVALAIAVTRLLRGAAGSFLPRAEEIELDGRLLLFSLLLSLLAGAASGLWPALRAANGRAPFAALVGRGLSRSGRSLHSLPGAGLVALEVALALILVTGGGLMLRSFQKLVARDLGFESEGVVTARIALEGPRYDTPEKRVQYWEQLQQELASLPVTGSVGFAHATPAGYGALGFIEVAGRSSEDDSAGYRVVSDDYFRVLGVPLLAGRSFGGADRLESPRVTVINRRMAETYWPDGDPLGRRLRALSMEIREGSPWLEVVGVVGDVRHFGHESPPKPEMFVLYRQVPSWADEMTIVAAAGPGASTDAVASAVRQSMREQDPDLAAGITTLEAQVDGLLAERSFVMRVLSGFSALALALAAVGLYGLLSFAVGQRTREIGIRATLGADRAEIVRLVVRAALRVVLAGLALGALAALWLGELIRGLLVEVSPRDPEMLLTAVAILLATAAAAATGPAWRAMAVDPVRALRAE